MAQRGSMDANGRWLAFRAKAVYGAEPLTYAWQARLSVMLGMWVVARDGHADGQGWGGAKLWGIKSIGQSSGPDVLTMQVIRNVAELVWAPELARREPDLTWSDAGADAFEIMADAGGHEARVRFDVDGDGDVLRASSASRPYDVAEGFDTAPWRCDFSDHRDFDGVRMPAHVVARYEFEDEPWEYFRAEVVSVDREPAAS